MSCDARAVRSRQVSVDICIERTEDIYYYRARSEVADTYINFVKKRETSIIIN